MGIRDYIRVFRKGWVFIVALTLLGIGLGAAYSIAQTPKYQATAQVFVSIQSAGSVSELTQGGNYTANQVKSFADVATSPLVLKPVIDELGLDVSVDELSRSVKAEIPVDTVILSITVTNADPELAAKVANSVADNLQAAVGTLVPKTVDGSSPVKMSTTREATVPQAPFTPNVPLNIVMGGAIGLAIGLVLAFLREILDTRIRNEHDVEAILPTAILGGITFDPRTPEHPLVVQDDPRSPRAEAFRTLRTNLQFLDYAGAAKSFVITSSVPGEGKSTTAANLALVTAANGKSVAVIDADLRKPKLAAYLGVEGGAGLTDVLVGRAEPNDVIQRWGASNLYILPAGRIPPNPSELLGSDAMVRLLRTLEHSFDVVFIDAPPILPVTDAAILAKSAGGTLVIVGSGRVHKGQLRGAISALQNVGARVSGVVLTMLPTRGPDSYGYGRYGYGYTYGYAGEADIDSTMDASLDAPLTTRR
ncbi:polysaccharide biosynthesis tyrosine autokinase [Herbiconiux sp. UC225_62]|uniref:polysaccharide biosynthesis tyrosine autokinase n=1 Tax=Herbiconiux sp. UC225_62 TaxID=3350168 RepID=UPI0036D3BC90